MRNSVIAYCNKVSKSRSNGEQVIEITASHTDDKGIQIEQKVSGLSFQATMHGQDIGEVQDGQFLKLSWEIVDDPRVGQAVEQPGPIP